MPRPWEDRAMKMRGAGRYAPSPSGRLHLGNLRTALVAWLFARSSGRRFLMRIEDVDRGRDAGAAGEQLAELASIGIDWDGEPVFQTARREAHEAAIARLAREGLVYECYCSRREIQEAPTAPHAPPGAYPGTCRDLSEAERIKARARIAPRLPALRLRAPAGVHEGTFDDLLLGAVTGGIDDFVLRRGDNAIAYNLAVVVDDAEMGVDQAVRGDDLASSTPRQLLLQQLLGLPRPQYAHVPLVLGPSGARLAKRDGAVTLEDLAETGVRVTNETLLARFDPAALPRTPWVWQAGAAPERNAATS